MISFSLIPMATASTQASGRTERAASMKKLLLDVHIYVSLLCAAYLVMYGVSAICFNHEVQASGEDVQWAQTITVPVAETDQAVAEAVRDRLDLIGWVPFWRLSNPQPDQFQFFLDRPGKTYRLVLHQSTGQVQVTETRKGVLSVILSLHGLNGIPNSAWGNSWGLFSEISIWALIFAVISGIYFWWGRAAERRAGGWLLGLESGGSVLFMLYLVG